jgi:anti-sigma B factor antagonist
MEQSALRVVAIKQDVAANAYHLRLTGDLDLDSAPTLTEQFDRCIDAGATLIMLDATDVQFMDSSGMRAIITAENRLSAVNGRLLIDGISGAVQRVLEVSGLIDRYRRGPDE